MRKPRLVKETLVEFTVGELTTVGGGAATVAALCTPRTVATVCTGPTLTLTCWSEVDGCVTAQICS